MNGDKIPKALESLRAATRALRKCNNADPRRVIAQLAAALDATAHARDMLALEYEATIDHLHATVTHARERTAGHDPTPN